MSTNEIIERFWDAIEVGDEDTVSEVVHDVPTEELTRALHRCNCLIRKAGAGYKGTRDIVSAALKQKA